MVKAGLKPGTYMGQEGAEHGFAAEGAKDAVGGSPAVIPTVPFAKWDTFRGFLQGLKLVCREGRVRGD